MAGASRTKQPDVVEDVAWACAAALAARRYGVRTALVLDIRGRSTRATGMVLEARRAALYLAATALNQRGRQLCRSTGMDHKTIKHHLERVEDDRDLMDDLDQLMAAMTDQLQLGLAAMVSELRPGPPVLRVVA